MFDASKGGLHGQVDLERWQYLATVHLLESYTSTHCNKTLLGSYLELIILFFFFYCSTPIIMAEQVVKKKYDIIKSVIENEPIDEYEGRRRYSGWADNGYEWSDDDYNNSSFRAIYCRKLFQTPCQYCV